MGDHWLGFALLYFVVLALLMLLGAHVTKVWRGLFIDARRKVSLSRVQIIFWTVLIISAIAWFAFASKSTNVHIPQSLWALLGISGFSLVGAEVIKGTKGDPNKADAARLKNLTLSNNEVSMGLLLANRRKEDARLIDIFKGEELPDGALVDISKVQMFMISLFVYASYIYALMQPDLGLSACVGEAEPVLDGLCAAPADAVTTAATEQSEPVVVKGYQLPGLSDGMIALLAISHGGYLSIKAAPKPVPPAE